MGTNSHCAGDNRVGDHDSHGGRYNSHNVVVVDLHASLVVAVDGDSPEVDDAIHHGDIELDRPN